MTLTFTMASPRNSTTRPTAPRLSQHMPGNDPAADWLGISRILH